MISLIKLLVIIVIATISVSSVLCDESSELLMIGNSYTIRNNLDQMVANLLREGLGDPSVEVGAKRLARNGHTFRDHVNDGVVEQTLGQKQWKWVLLQEQSETPGFYQTEFANLFDSSMDAIVKLNDMITTKTNAEIILLSTWGYLHGDNFNPGLYDSYITMQHRLTDGYQEYQEQISTSNRFVKIAPAGIAFKLLYFELLRDGFDPVADNTAFSNLYDRDGIHPSNQGSYLVSCVVYATLTGYSPEGLQWAPKGISDEIRDRLQVVAASAVTSFNSVELTPSPGILSSSEYDDEILLSSDYDEGSSE